MVVEMEVMNKNEGWDLVKLPTEIKTIGRKWLLKKKFDT
jgi:hypothetical protein